MGYNCKDKRWQEVKDIFIESRRIHARVIIDFFSGSKHREDDIIVDDIVTEPNEYYHLEKTNYSDIRNMTNKATAHLARAGCTSSAYPPGDKCRKAYADLAEKIFDFTENINAIIKDDLKTKLQDEAVCTLIEKIKLLKELIKSENPNDFS